MNQSDGSSHTNISAAGCCCSLYVTVGQFKSLLKLSLTLMIVTAVYRQDGLDMDPRRKSSATKIKLPYFSNGGHFCEHPISDSLQAYLGDHAQIYTPPRALNQQKTRTADSCWPRSTNPSLKKGDGKDQGLS